MMNRIKTATVAISCLLGTAAAASDNVQYFHDRQSLQQLLNADDADLAAAYELAHELNLRNGTDASQWWIEGRIAEALENWPASARAYEQAMALGAEYEAATARRIAKAYALMGDESSALQWLEAAISRGLDQRHNLPDQEEFASLRNNPKFIELSGLATRRIGNRAQRWRHDIDFFVAEAQRLHASPSRPAFSQEFLDAAEELKRRARGLTDTEIMMALQKMIVMLGDGHSYLRVGFINEKAPNPADVDSSNLPVFFHPFENDLYIIKGVDEGAELVGGRVTRIGDLPVSDFISASLPYIHKDNAEGWKFIGAQFAYRLVAFHKALDTFRDGVPITVEFPDGSQTSKTLEGGDYAFTRKLRPLPSMENPPRFLSRIDTTYWSENISGQNAYYIQINNIRNADEGGSLAEFSSHAVNEAIRLGTENLIVDFRSNNGGNNTLCDALIENLLRFQFAGDRHRIFVITRHETFSAAQNCSTRIESATNAIFAGEPSASKPNFTGEETEVMLPYSGITASISNRYWQDSLPWDNRQWIAMDIPAPLTFEAYVSGRDPALEAIFAIIGEAD